MAEREQPTADREHVVECGVLIHGRAAGREVTRAAVAEPPAREPDVHVLRDRELAFRAADEGTVRVDVAGDRERIDDLPTRGLEPAAVLGMARDVHGDAEALTGEAR